MDHEYEIRVEVVGAEGTFYTESLMQKRPETETLAMLKREAVETFEALYPDAEIDAVNLSVATFEHESAEPEHVYVLEPEE